MTENEVTEALVKSGGNIAALDASLRLSVLCHMSEKDISEFLHFLPRPVAGRLELAHKIHSFNDPVTLYVIWLSALLESGYRFEFDLSMEESTLEDPGVLLLSPLYGDAQPSLGILRIGFFLRSLGIRTDWRWPSPHSLEDLIAFCEKGNYQVFGQSTTDFTLPNDLRLMTQLHEVNPNAMFVLGGHGAIFTGQQLSKLFHNTPINYVVRGLGERTMARLILSSHKLGIPSRGLTEANVPGIQYLDSRREVTDNGMDYYSPNEYRAVNAIFDPRLYPVKSGTSYLMTSSHCPVGCIFCSSTRFLHQPVLRLPPSDVAYYILRLQQAHPYLTRLEFNDDNFSVDYVENGMSLKGDSWLTELITELNGNLRDGLAISCLSRADTMEIETLKTMKNELNLSRIGIGLEHVDPVVLEHMGKGIDSRTSIEFIREALALGIQTEFFIILFSKWETSTSLLHLLDVSNQLCLEGAQLVYNWGLQPLRGSRIAQNESNRLLQHKYEIGEYQEFFHSKIIPDDKFIGDWFCILNEMKSEFFDLQEELYDQFTSALEASLPMGKSYWLDAILKSPANLNKSQTLVNLIRIYAMFEFGCRHMFAELEYFNRGKTMMYTTIVNYLFSGPIHRFGDSPTIDEKARFLRRHLPQHLAETPQVSLLIDLEVALTGLSAPRIGGLSIPQPDYHQWISNRLSLGLDALRNEAGNKTTRDVKHRITALMRMLSERIGSGPITETNRASSYVFDAVQRKIGEL